MKITVNGQERLVEAPATVADLVAEAGNPQSTGRGMAVAVNGEVVPRGLWTTTPLAADDRVEILRAVGGG